MIVEKTEIEDCYLIQPQKMGDERGYFMESYNKRTFEKETGLKVNFVQDNMAYSEGKVLRGLHFQKGEHAQAKLVSVLQGEVQDVIVDLRKNSSSFGKSISVILRSDLKNQVYLPRGCAHGYLTLTEKVLFYYKCDNFYQPESDSGLHFTDPTVDIRWMLNPEDAIISDKDKNLAYWDSIEKFD